MHVLLLLVTTTLAKKLGNRPRPNNPQELQPKPSNCRYLNLRAHEKNKSMPSADTAQAALFVAFIRLNMPNFYSIFGGPFLPLNLIFQVALGRVVYHCHYFGDTLVGAIIGTLVGQLGLFLNLNEVALPIS